MSPTQSSWGMTMIVNDLADAMDRLVDRASKPKNNRGAGGSNKAPASNQND